MAVEAGAADAGGVEREERVMAVARAVRVAGGNRALHRIRSSMENGR